MFLALSGSISAEPVTQLKVLTFNIWPYGPNATINNWVAVIRTNNADVIGLQETTAANAQAIAAQLGFYWTQGAGSAECAILSRYPLVSLGQTTAPYGGVGAVIELSPGQHATFYSAHLHYTPYGPYWLKQGSNTTAIVNMENSTRMPGLNDLLNMASPYLPIDKPAFLVGDFNTPSHLDYADLPWPVSIACSNAGFGDSYRELHPGNRTYPGAFGFNEPGITWTPVLGQEPFGVFDRIDFIHYSLGDGVVPVSSTELDGSNGFINPWPSDHRAVLTTFAVTPPSLGSIAANPFPANNDTNVAKNILLLWTPASNAVSHSVYFGTNSPGILSGITTNSMFVPGQLLSGRTYFWRVDTTTDGGTITGAVWTFTVPAIPVFPANTYEWTFALGDLRPALGNGVLNFRDTTTSNSTVFGATDGSTVPHMNGQSAKYMRVPRMPSAANGYHVTFTGSGPNGGGSYINQYTVIMDILVPSPLGWDALLNTDPNNTSGNDADFYISPTGGVGSTPGYSTNNTIKANTWHRLAFVADLVVGTLSYYVDGAKVVQTAANGLDGRWAISSSATPGPDLLLFNEGDTSGNYTHTNYLSAWAFVDRALTDEEIATLAGPNRNGIFGGDPILIAATRTETHVELNWTGGKGPFQVRRAETIVSPWQNAGSLSYERMFTAPLTNTQEFFRITGN